MMKWLKNFWGDESGITAVEYGLILAAVSVAVIGVLLTMDNSTLINSVQEAVPPAVE